jgi:hypothetical protein
MQSKSDTTRNRTEITNKVRGRSGRVTARVNLLLRLLRLFRFAMPAAKHGEIYEQSVQISSVPCQ